MTEDRIRPECDYYVDLPQNTQLVNCVHTSGRSYSCGTAAQKKQAACLQEAWNASNAISLGLDAAAIIPGGGDLADLARVGGATVTTVLGALGSDSRGISASLAGGSTSIASLNKGSLSKAAGEAIPFAGTFVGLYAVGHDLSNIQADYNKCMSGG